MRHIDPREEQQTPAAMVTELMLNIRNQFYGNASVHAWARDQHYIKREVVLWPASWLNEKGLIMPVAKYRAMLLEKINCMKRGCRQTTFDYFPAYLAHCIRDHFRHNEDAIYDEAKSLRTPLAAVLSKLPGPTVVDAVAPLAAAHQVLVGQKRTRKAQAKPSATQGELL